MSTEDARYTVETRYGQDKTKYFNGTITVHGNVNEKVVHLRVETLEKLPVGFFDDLMEILDKHTELSTK